MTQTLNLMLCYCFFAVALALVLGANLGSGISAFLTTSGNNQPGKRVTLGNLLSRLRERRDRAQSLAAKARREARRGGGGFDHSNSGMRQKSGLLAEAVRRVNKEAARRGAGQEG